MLLLLVLMLEVIIKLLILLKNIILKLDLYDIIYKVVEDMESAMKGMLEPIYEEKSYWYFRS